MDKPTEDTQMETLQEGDQASIMINQDKGIDDVLDREQLVFLQPTPIQIDDLETKEEQIRNQSEPLDNDEQDLVRAVNNANDSNQVDMTKDQIKSPKLPPRQPLLSDDEGSNTDNDLPQLPPRIPQLNTNKELPQLPVRETVDPLINEHMILHRLDETIKELKLNVKYVNNENNVVENDNENNDTNTNSIWNELIANPEFIIKNKYEIIEEKLISEDGVPTELRKQIWQSITFRNLHHWDKIYEPLLSKRLDQDENAIKSTLAQFGDKSDTLFNIIKSYLNLDPEIKYSEDILNILIPIFDTTEQDEKSTFSLLISIMKEYNMREFYLKDEFYDISQILYQFDRILESKNFEIYNHFMMQGVKSNMFISDWIRTLLDKIIANMDDKLRLIDLIYFFGIEIMLIVIIDLVVANKERIMSLVNDDLLYFLKDLKGMSPYKENDELDKSESIKLFIIESLKSNTVKPKDLMKYSKEFVEIYSGENALKQEMQRIRGENNRLQKDVKRLEHDYTFLNVEHITIANESLQNKLKIQETNDLNINLQMTIIELKKKMKTLQKENKLNSNNINDIPNELQSQLDKTIKKNGEVMQKNLILQDQITKNENIINQLKEANEQKEYLESMFKDSKIGWAGIKKFSITKW